MLKLNGEGIRIAMDKRYEGSVTRLTAALALDPLPDRSTVARWLLSDGSHFPRDEERILALAGALDVDPTSLWTFNAETFPVLWPKIAKAARTGSWSDLLTSLSFMRHFTEPAEEWPPRGLADRFFGREWMVREFAHDPRSKNNFYQSLVVRSETVSEDRPHVCHFAFRPHDRRPRGWKPFGFTRHEATRVTLFSDFGIAEERPCVSRAKEICVKTWFGPGPALFRVASLHPFALYVGEPSDVDMPTVHFGFPGETS